MLPTIDEHSRWTRFAVKHAPELHVNQTDTSKIESFIFFWAAQHEFMHPENSVRIRTTDNPHYSVYKTAASLSRVKGVSTFCKKVAQEFPWVVRLVRQHLTTCSMYIDAHPDQELDERRPQAVQGRLVIDALRDCLLDYDSAVDIITFLNEECSGLPYRGFSC